jgi:hypothetical protein
MAAKKQVRRQKEIIDGLAQAGHFRRLSPNEASLLHRLAIDDPAKGATPGGHLSGPRTAGYHFNTSTIDQGRFCRLANAGARL